MRILPAVKKGRTKANTRRRKQKKETKKDTAVAVSDENCDLFACPFFNFFVCSKHVVLPAKVVHAAFAVVDAKSFPVVGNCRSAAFCLRIWQRDSRKQAHGIRMHRV